MKYCNIYPTNPILILKLCKDFGQNTINQFPWTWAQNFSVKFFQTNFYIIIIICVCMCVHMICVYIICMQVMWTNMYIWGQLCGVSCLLPYLCGVQELNTSYQVYVGSSFTHQDILLTPFTSRLRTHYEGQGTCCTSLTICVQPKESM